MFVFLGIYRLYVQLITITLIKSLCHVELAIIKGSREENYLYVDIITTSLKLHELILIKIEDKLQFLFF